MKYDEQEEIKSKHVKRLKKLLIKKGIEETTKRKIEEEIKSEKEEKIKNKKRIKDIIEKYGSMYDFVYNFYTEKPSKDFDTYEHVYVASLSLPERHSYNFIKYDKNKNKIYIDYGYHRNHHVIEYKLDLDGEGEKIRKFIEDFHQNLEKEKSDRAKELKRKILK